MTDSGYIKLHRAIQGWEWYSDGVTFRVFVYLLLNANWEDSRYRGHEVPKGSLVTSYGSIAEALNISVQNARTAINHLKSTGELTVKLTSKFQIITIENWDKYQCQEFETNRQTNRQANNQLTGNQQATNNIKEYKEYKNIKKRDNTTPNGKPSYTPEFFAELEREVKEK